MMSEQDYWQSQVKSNCRELKWDIGDFNSILGNQCADPLDWRSKDYTFTIEPFGSVTAWMTLKLNGRYLTIGLAGTIYRNAPINSMIGATFEMHGAGADGNMQFQRSVGPKAWINMRRIPEFQVDVTCYGKGWHDSFTKQTYFPDGVLRVRVLLSFVEIESVDGSKQLLMDKKLEEDTMAALMTDFRKLRSDEKSGDVTILCGPKPFHAHKLILTARSAVFARMFANDMKESQTNTISIEDVEPSTFSALLDFIYLAQLPGRGEALDVDSLSGIALAAHKYLLQDLQKHCLNQMIRNLNCKTLGKIAMTFYLCSTERKDHEQIWDFCSKNWLELRHDPELVKMTRDYPDAFFPPTSS